MEKQEQHNYGIEGKIDESREIAQAVNLTRNLESQTTKYERNLSREEYFEVVRYAEVLRDLDDKERARIIRESLDQEFPLTNFREGIPVIAAYRYAETLGIPKEYVDKALETRIINEEDKLRDIVNAGANIDPGVMLRAFRDIYGGALVNELKKIYPYDQIYFTEGCLSIDFIRETKIKRRFFFSKRKKEKLACIDFHYNHSATKYDIRTYVGSPQFLKICSFKLKELDKILREIVNNSIHIYYNIDLQGVLNNDYQGISIKDF